MKVLYFIISFIFLSNELSAQDTIPCSKKPVKYVGRIISECIYIDSVEQYFVDEFSVNVLYTTEWRDNIPDRKGFFSFLRDSIIDGDYISVNKIEDSIFIYRNLMQINIINNNILSIFPKSISKLRNLSGIYNSGIISDISFENVPALDSLLAIGLGTVTDSLTKVPKILYSKNLREIEILYFGEGDEVILKILRKMLHKKSIKKITVIPQYEVVFSSMMNDELLKLKLEYEKKDKSLVVY